MRESHQCWSVGREIGKESSTAGNVSTAKGKASTSRRSVSADFKRRRLAANAIAQVSAKELAAKRAVTLCAPPLHQSTSSGTSSLATSNANSFAVTDTTSRAASDAVGLTSDALVAHMVTPELAAAEEQEAFEQGVVEQAAAEQALVELEAEQALAEEHLAKQIAVDQAAEPAPECVPDCFPGTGGGVCSFCSHEQCQVGGGGDCKWKATINAGKLVQHVHREWADWPVDKFSEAEWLSMTRKQQTDFYASQLASIRLKAGANPRLKEKSVWTHTPINAGQLVRHVHPDWTDWPVDMYSEAEWLSKSDKARKDFRASQLASIRLKASNLPHQSEHSKTARTSPSKPPKQPKLEPKLRQRCWSRPGKTDAD